MKRDGDAHQALRDHEPRRRASRRRGGRLGARDDLLAWLAAALRARRGAGHRRIAATHGPAHRRLRQRDARGDRSDGAKIIKASRVRSKATLQAAAAFHTEFHLLDAHVAGMPGGTGQTVDWELVRRHAFSSNIILSGGLTPDNVAVAVAATEPFAVDVASGTELRPGVKDPELLTAFAEAVRSTWPEEDERAVQVAEAAAAARAEVAHRVAGGDDGSPGPEPEHQAEPDAEQPASEVSA